MIRGIGIRPIIFSVNCYIATILTMFVAFSLDLKSPGWAMTTVYLTSQPLSGAMRAKAFYRAIGTFIGGGANERTDGTIKGLGSHGAGQRLAGQIDRGHGPAWTLQVQAKSDEHRENGRDVAVDGEYDRPNANAFNHIISNSSRRN